MFGTVLRQKYELRLIYVAVTDDASQTHFKYRLNIKIPFLISRINPWSTGLEP